MTTAADTHTPLFIPALRPVYASLSDVADAVVRIAAGLFLVPHGAQKLFGWFGGYGLDGTAGFFGETLGLGDGYLAALGAGSVEFFGGLLLALGLLTRVAAGAGFVVLVVAAALVHVGNGFFNQNGGWEYAILWAIVAGSYAIKGGGRYSLDRLIGREI